MNRSKIDFRGALGLVLLTLAASGCTICQSPDLESYTTYGGLWHRTDRNHGRVGSVFSPAGFRSQSGAKTLSRDAAAAAETVPPGEASADEPSIDPSGEAGDTDATEPQPRVKPDLRDLELDDIEGRFPPDEVPEA